MRLRVDGRVQGVAYRASTQHEASRLGLTGWVRNLPDGAVELEAQGPAAVVAALEAWCRRGPSLARVTRVTCSPCAPIDGEHGFSIRR
ncbi:MAG TPA: acylphosphatase [Kofleriaceae bacterium]|nr:acylphosphatase [Kofleriaceae bacterium]